MLCCALNWYEWNDPQFSIAIIAPWMCSFFPYTFLYRHLDKYTNVFNVGHWQSDPKGLICIMLRSWWDLGDFSDIQGDVTIPQTSYHKKPLMKPLIARFLGPTWGSPGAERTQVGPMNLAILDLQPWKLYLESFYHSKIWQASQQHWSHGICQISKLYDYSNYQSPSLEDLQYSW